jgi:hypothetical protein
VGREDFRFAITIVGDFTGRISNANELGPREHGRRAVTHLTIELATDHEHRVGVRHRSGPHRADDPWMISWHKAAALPRIEIDGAKRVEKANDLRSGFASAAVVTTKGRYADQSASTACSTIARSGGMTRGFVHRIDSSRTRFAET